MRRQARITAFSIIFQRLFVGNDEFDGERFDELKKLEDRQFARDIVDAFDLNKSLLQQLVQKNLKGYELDRVYRVDLALTYMALCEIKFLNTPAQVAINEAIEIAKEYSTEKSSKFIHGLLSAILKDET